MDTLPEDKLPLATTGMRDPAATTDPAAMPAAVKESPDADTPENMRQRSLVVFSFWAVVLLLGLPLWWITTSIYRAPLPLQEMQSWANGRVRASVLSCSATELTRARPAGPSSRCLSTSKLICCRTLSTY